MMSNDSVVKTKFLGPTNHRGARVKATDIVTNKSVTVSWDYSAGIFTNHQIAASRLNGGFIVESMQLSDGELFIFRGSI